MKKIILFIWFIFLSSVIYSQVEFSDPNIIADDFEPRANKSISVCDIDNDGDNDVVATDYTAIGEMPLLTWYENDGSGNFTRHIVSTENLSSEENICGTCVCTADLDNDNDRDIILGAFTGENSIAWFENIDNNGNFSSFKTIKGTEGHHFWPHAADFDNDGDADVIDADWDGLEFYRNTNGHGTFNKETINGDAPASLISLDVGNDGDNDIIAGFENRIVWYENVNGNGSFSVEKLITRSGYGFLYLADIDHDGYPDLLSAGGSKLAWFKNTNGQGSFGSAHTISSSVINAYAVCTADLDGDGDHDVLSGSLFDSKLAWYENIDGQGNFGNQNLIAHNFYGVASVHTADIDNDGRPDIVAATVSDYTNDHYTPGTIFWIKNNTHFTSIAFVDKMIPDQFQLYQNYPNPFNPSTTITFSIAKQGQYSVNVFNLSGQCVAELFNGDLSIGNHQIEFDGSQFASGIYFYRVTGYEVSMIGKMVLAK
jgi:hypothetical protein